MTSPPEESVQPVAAARAERIHYMDSVRGLAMLLGVFFHAGLIYADTPQVPWLMATSERSTAIGAFVWLSHIFRMPVFFLVAGFFAHLLIQRRGIRGFVKNRFKRITLPFVIFYPLLTIAIGALVVYATRHMEVLPPRLEVIADSLQNGEARRPLRTWHLWFLYYLMMLCVLTALFGRYRSPRLRRIVSAFFASPKNLLWAPLLLVPVLATFPPPTPSPMSFAPRLWPIGYYGFFFFFGWHLLRHPHYLDKIEAIWPRLALASAIGYVGYFLLLPSAGSEHATIPFWHLASTTVLGAYLSIYLTLLALTAGRRFLGRPNRALRYLSDASYWIYLVHIPLVIWLQIFLAEVDTSPLLKFSIVSFGTIAIAVAVYDIAIRYTAIGTLLNGKKTRGG